MVLILILRFSNDGGNSYGIDCFHKHYTFFELKEKVILVTKKVKK